MRALVVLLSLLTPVWASAAEQPATASGSLKVNGSSTTLHYAYAFFDPEQKATRVLIVNRPLAAKLLAEETSGQSSGDTPSLRDRMKKGEISGIELFVEPSNEVHTVEVFDKAFGTTVPTTGFNFWYEPYQLTGGLIGARSRTKQPETFFKDVWEYDVKFLTTVGPKGFEIPSQSALAAAHKANDAREAARLLPAGGGEEGAMYLQYRKNVEAKDGKALLDQMTASMKTAVAKQMHTSDLSESTTGSWAFMQSMPPGKVEVVGGVRDPDATILELRKTDASGRKSFGTARIVKERGAWKVAEDNWR